MAINLLAEYGGFLKFFNRANSDLIRWFGPHCNNDPASLAFLAAREWDGMCDLERKPFIKSSTTNGSQGVNSYIRYLLHSRYSSEISFDPKSGKQLGQNWKSMTSDQKGEFSSLDPAESGIEHVIRHRDELHKIYDPKTLCVLEFILKTKPRWPSSSRLWYFRHEGHSISSSEARRKWVMLSDEERTTYETCAVLDKKRYHLEKNAWITKVITIDIDDNQFTLSDFEIPEVRSRINSLGSFVEMSKDLPSLIGLKRPRNPFSLFIEAYRYQIRDERPEFQFGKHLRECSEAWNKLSDQEKEKYKEESRRLKEARRNLLSEQPLETPRLTVPMDLLSTNKSFFGLCRPSHLYPRATHPMNIWYDEVGRTLGVSKKDCKERWESLCVSEKQLYLKKHEEMKENCERKKGEIDRKHKQIKAMLKEATKLQDLKQKYRLMGCTSKQVKNLYK